MSSVMVVDMLNFTFGVKTYEFSEEGTNIDQITNPGEELVEYISKKIASQNFEKLVLVGPVQYTSNFKNQISSQLQLNFGQKNPIEIELKEGWN